MANEDLLFKFRGDGADAVNEAKRVRKAIVDEAQAAAKQFGTAGTSAGTAFSAGLRQSSADLQSSLVASLKSAQREGDGLFNVLTQLRIGLTQLGRGDIGGIPNLIKAYREFTGVGNEARRAIQLLDAAFVASGVKVTNAGERFEEFRDKVARALSGSDKRARELQAAFSQIGINLTDALLRPEQAFTQLLKVFGGAKKGSDEFNAALELLGLNAGKAANAAQIAGRSMTQLSAGLGITAGAAVATGGAILVVVAAIVAVVAAVKAFEFAVSGIVETAKQVGTKSKEDFEEFKKKVESAGFAVTQLDRNLSQGIVKALDQVKGASDGLFVQMVESTGPELILLLRSVAGLLKDIAPLAELAGRFIAAHFLAATAAVRTFRQFLETDAPVWTLPALFASHLREAAKQARELTVALPKATFDGDSTKKAKDATLERIRLLEIEERAAQRVFREETEGAERAFRLRLIDGEELTARLTRAEKVLLAAKLAVIETERKALEDGSLSDEKAATKRAELREKELQALSDYRRAIQKINDDAAQRADDDIKKALDDARKVAEARIRLLSDLTRLQAEIRQIQIDSLQTTADSLSRTPGREQEAIEARTRVFIEQERLRHDQLVADIEARKAENDLAERDSAEKFKIEQALNQQLEAEERRHAQAVKEIRINTRADLAQSGGFDQGQSEAIAQMEEALGRQLTGWERLRVAMAATAATMRSQLPSGAAVATQALTTMSKALSSGIAAFASGQSTLRQALGGIVKAIFDSLAQVAVAKGAEQFAWALSELALGNYAKAAKHFAAGAAWSALGGLVSGLGSAAANGISGSGSGGGALGNQVSGTRQSENTIATEDRIRFREGNAQGFAVQITLKTDRAQLVSDVETGALQSFRNNGTVKQVLDNHTAGIPIGG
ncbi:MAG TPA: hypothetical protein VNQ79_06635 [Blastocatellia bacterium]|nr:hypothetical protein [Blastocatellia bacterium]